MTASYILLALSVISLACGIGLIVTFILTRKHSRAWWAVALIIFTVALFQISLNLAYPYEYGGTADDVKIPLSNWELTARIISSTLQTFSLDLGYPDIVRAGEAAFSGFAMQVFVFMACAMTLIAPATGGVAVFGILCNFFPYLWLAVSCRRTKFVFSELNEYSIETAESIVEKKKYLLRDREARKAYGKENWKYLKSSLIVFTDVYTDGADETYSELLARAKKLGAVCLRDDVAERTLSWWFPFTRKKLVYFLMDKDEAGNLKSAISLLSTEKQKMRWASFNPISGLFKADRMEMYVFTRNSEANGIVEAACGKFEENFANSPRAKKPMVLYKTINEFRNLVYQLIDGYECDAAGDGNTAERPYPLYWSLLPDGGQIKGKGIEKLTVTIIGGGRIGKEFFKAAYWCGQMLYCCDKSIDGSLPYTPTKFKINVISNDADRAENMLRFEMPEAFDEKYKSYCEFTFSKAEFATSQNGESGFTNTFASKCGDSDYVLVALGNDGLNLSAARWIKRALDTENIRSPKKVPVNFIVENGDLCGALLSAENSEIDVGSILHPFGSLSQRYSYDNICLSKLEERACNVNRAHDPESDGEAAREAFIKNEYSRNSSMASALHYPYKLASFGMLDGRKLLKNGEINGIEYGSFDGPLYWLEHRRWCAYIRAIGRRCPTAGEFFSYALKDGKFDKINYSRYNENLKLHPCLLESGEGLLSLAQVNKRLETLDCAALIDSGKKANEIPLGEWLNNNVRCENDGLDALDRLSFIAGKDFKLYDVTVVRNMYRDEIRRVLADALDKGDLRARIPNAARHLTYFRAADGDVTDKSGVEFIKLLKWNKFYLFSFRAEFKSGVQFGKFINLLKELKYKIYCKENEVARFGASKFAILTPEAVFLGVPYGDEFNELEKVAGIYTRAKNEQ